MSIATGTDRSRNLSPNGRAALGLAARGIHVFPVRAGTKFPLVRWATEATTDPETIIDWYTRWPAASVAVACGPSGLIVIDVDGPAGAESWAALTAQHGEVATCTVTTGRDSGGRHLWFLAGDGPSVRNSAGLLGPGLDVRGVGGMVLSPPSVHRSGRHYEWANRAPLAPLPDWLRQAATPAPQPVRRATPGRVSTASADKVLAALVRVVLTAPEGTRNDRLFWSAVKVVEHADAGRLDTETSVDALLRAAEAVGLPPAEAARTIRSAVEGPVRA
ncbi:bifunctional DNA primase/polymerase [Protofrankia coriariae]|uniref:DNA primase/polymerase bifunctional N-terminal domain-containing protein n=1 Tax=Protofrankia coriariae TaxID=1562887 RepID=A0ABR5F5A4_9ACTN|nr:bifunctional DNA primase/polymerase [Protofrankia coriariae]KLL11840.1 hypothetical protein FrCorBMG51_08410 [Protofrankia coriariae]